MIDAAKLILRLAVGGLLILHGISKLRHGIAWMAGPLHAHHLPMALGYGVYLAEVVAPILLILGILTRPAALVIVFELSMALFLVVQGRTFTLDRQTGGLGGELQFLYIASALAIALLGSGRFAVWQKRSRWN